MKYAFIKNHELYYRLEALCEVLGVSRSSYYEWLIGKDDGRAKANQELLIKIKEVHAASKEVYGYRRVYQALRVSNLTSSSKNRIYRVMRNNHLFSKTKRKFRVTTNSRHSLPIAENILNREFKAVAPNRVWVGDISYIWTKEGWLYLAVVIDLYSKAVVGWAVSEHLRAKLVADALLQAIWQRQPRTGLVFHSDRGIQYASESFKNLLNLYNLILSMSRKGNCWDNAVAESFFKTIKVELIYHNCYATREEAKTSIFEYIEVFYNRKRLHSSIGYMAPMQFEVAA